MLGKSIDGISYTEYRSNEYVWQHVIILAGLSTVKRCKLSWFGHVCRHDELPKIMPHEKVDGSRRRGRLGKSWKDNVIKEWTGQSMSYLLGIAVDRGRWAVIAANASINDVWASRVLVI